MKKLLSIMFLFCVFHLDIASADVLNVDNITFPQIAPFEVVTLNGTTQTFNGYINWGGLTHDGFTPDSEWYEMYTLFQNAYFDPDTAQYYGKDYAVRCGTDHQHEGTGIIRYYIHHPETANLGWCSTGFFVFNASDVVSLSINNVPLCNFPTYCSFPNFPTLGQYIDGEYVYKMDVFNGVQSYLNSKNDGTSSSSYYQCTEYAARYLHDRFGTDYTYSKKINDSNTQGFRGFDFHPNYEGNPPRPTVDKGGNTISLASVTAPQAGDIAIFTTLGHTAIVKSVNGPSATLIEQNYISNNKYTTNRTVSASASGLNFYRYTAAVIQGADSPYTSIQDAYNSASTNDQTILTQSLVFTESPEFSNDISITLKGGYDDNFSSNTGMTIIKGKLTINNGSVAVNRICIQ